MREAKCGSFESSDRSPPDFAALNPGYFATSHAKLAKDHVENFFHVHPAGEFAQAGRGAAQLLGHQLLAGALVREFESAGERARDVGERRLLALARDQRRLRGEKILRMAREIG